MSQNWSTIIVIITTIVEHERLEYLWFLSRIEIISRLSSCLSLIHLHLIWACLRAIIFMEETLNLLISSWLVTCHYLSLKFFTLISIYVIISRWNFHNISKFLHIGWNDILCRKLWFAWMRQIISLSHSILMLLHFLESVLSYLYEVMLRQCHIEFFFLKFLLQYSWIWDCHIKVVSILSWFFFTNFELFIWILM